MTSSDFTNQVDGLINDFINGASDESEFRDGILNLLIEVGKKANLTFVNISLFDRSKFLLDEINEWCDDFKNENLFIPKDLWDARKQCAGVVESLNKFLGEKLEDQK